MVLNCKLHFLSRYRAIFERSLLVYDFKGNFPLYLNYLIYYYETYDNVVFISFYLQNLLRHHQHNS